MPNKSIRYLSYVVKAGIFVLPLLSLIVAETFFFPFVTGKNFFFRVVVEILFFLWVLLAVFDKKYRPKATPLIVAVSLTLFFLALAAVFGENPYRSFWSNYERMEGLVGHFHLFAYFLILASVFKTKKEWKELFGVMLGVSFVVTIYGFLQFFGKVAIHQSNIRLDATFGNATYLAIFLIFHLFLIALFLFWFRKLWLRICLAVVFVLELIIVFLTATRGAILGFLGGLFLFGLLMTIFGKNKKLRYTFAGVMVFVILAVSMFLIFKDNEIIKGNYVLSRFSNISFSAGTTQSRLTIWGMSWQGFQEHPFLGWGLENYNLVFNKYYESKLYKQEPWFDRSHNVLFDWLISAGALGFLAYLSIFVSVLYMLWRGYKKKLFSLFESAGVTSLLAAYVFHNLFVFDNLTSYFMFFSVLAFVHSSWVSETKEETKLVKRTDLSGWGYLIITLSFLFVIFSLYFVSIRPILTCKQLLRTMAATRQSQDVNVVLQNFDKVFSYNTFGTVEAREQLTAYANNIASSGFTPKDTAVVLARAIKEMEEQSLSSPDDIRYLIMLAALYAKGNRADDALATINRAIELSPNKQQIYYVKTDILNGVGKKEEALRAVKIAYELETSNEEAAKNLAILYIINGQEEEGEKLLIEHYSKIIMADKQLINAYARADNYEKVRDIWLEFIKKEPNNAQYHVNLAATYLELNEREKAIEKIQEAAELEPKFKEQAEYIISEIRAGRNP